ncbi:glutamine-dependent NAD(+) synthetase with GAT domain-containing protein [Gonapodya prolifera JEL478]|uniref:Glutamine-dependent NAD(+) synthetase n=1 Tax=Gonapodya prolifera (strain JEL478) TaxID=1344416 RepID=A0A139AED0_GONPJ|nr:glutamine-dependent NAD(+) synthetase with GAT domain-containing protein [Gonapodya prolifera JEL478]|eukprot:KXS15118.1 glutamine-dependent NAD(+) synthetase with GAT domain-containing protein [Gonapodya prolifera JEL478]
MGHLVTVAAAQLDQWALDFQGNLDRILQSIRQAKKIGAKYRIGPELEISGYGCGDHFLEPDTYLHSWEALAKLLEHPDAQEILLDVGMPVTHHSVHYNCRLFILNGRILLIRPKLHLASDGNYREARWFTTWSKLRQLEEHYLPRVIRKVAGQETVPFGDGVIATLDTVVGTELCEELFTPQSPHIAMGLDGVEIFGNPSASHWELRKLGTRIDLIKNATAKSGGIYVYCNQQGCDGDRLYFDGASMVVVNGKVAVMGTQFSLRDVEVVSATVDLESVRAYRGKHHSRSVQASHTTAYPRVKADFALSAPPSAVVDGTWEGDAPVGSHVDGKKWWGRPPTIPLESLELCGPFEEIAYGPACWLWDYLRRSKAAGFFVPLSGGVDSCAVSLIVYSMCRMVVDAVKEGDKTVLNDAKRIVGEDDSAYVPNDAVEFCGRIFHTCYMGSKNSTTETRKRAADLAQHIGSYHLDLDIDSITSAFLSVFSAVTKREPRFKVHGGSWAENQALQNVQARTRMVLAYLMGQLLPWCRGRLGGLLVLGTANVDESLRGYFTKYDCSAADLNPIGAISKNDLRGFIKYAQEAFDIPFLIEFLDAPPTAELEPITDSYQQKDEVDMGMTYDELSRFGRLRKVDMSGPWSMFSKLIYEWGSALSPSEIAGKVKRFFFYYSINRHKMTILTPSVHCESYSPDDNRFDLRPFLYNAAWTWQFSKIDRAAAEMEKGPSVTQDEATVHGTEPGSK